VKWLHEGMGKGRPLRGEGLKMAPGKEREKQGTGVRGGRASAVETKDIQLRPKFLFFFLLVLTQKRIHICVKRILVIQTGR
jgi:hypothetical protein